MNQFFSMINRSLIAVCFLLSLTILAGSDYTDVSVQDIIDYAATQADSYDMDFLNSEKGRGRINYVLYELRRMDAKKLACAFLHAEDYSQSVIALFVSGTKDLGNSEFFSSTAKKLTTSLG